MALSMKLKELRGKAGLSLEGAARKVDVAMYTWYRWERGEGKPSVGNLQKIAKAFKVSIDKLVKE